MQAYIGFDLLCFSAPVLNQPVGITEDYYSEAVFYKDWELPDSRICSKFAEIDIESGIH